ncbi:hypothetical protein CNMCM5793_004198 [Aspergillus hiratsukae]|uniref:F-box domain-containing protein n=1 Tax=Aspergillus hiratsukae TaxID=1194566 RepID=A0A8H6QBS7_9EURO|nr:hypothetical protein CNMCM5793_004198 [Aspergillus hiratsukae]KAF7169472.1 hypothetical protein CNMCM6106_004357 [Aspergillus hiratsukae]
MSFQALPPEIISLVIRFLADVHPLSIFRLLRVNKRCFTLALPVAKSLVFHTVRLQFSRRQRVDNQVATVCAKLQKADAFPYVRLLITEGFFMDENPPSDYDDEWFPPPVSRFSPLNRDPRDSYEFEEELESRNTIWRDTDIDYECWEGVAGLIKRLPALDDLHHLHYEQFPPCLLQALHQYRPECRLHLHSFVLWSVWEPTVEEHEYCLVTSPSLYSITPYYDTSTPEGVWQKRSFVCILGLAPNLKVIYPRADDPTYHASGAGMTKLMQKPGAENPAAIERLRVKHSYSPMLAAALEEWAPYIDFSTVQILDLGSSIQGEALAAWADRLHFPALRTLRLFLGAKRGGSEQEPEFYPHAARFLQTLPPLSEIHLEAWHSGLPIGTLAKRHGPRLRKLSVVGVPWQCVTKDDILQLGRYCPQLEKMTIPIRRTQGDAQEVALYKALGTIRNLKFLDLVLDVSDPTLDDEHASVDPHWDDFDNQPANVDLGGVNPTRNGHLRRLLINTLIDKQLASSIFEVISAAKPQHAPCGLLERLSLSVQGQTRPAHLAHCEFSHFVRLLSTEWTIERDIRYEHRERFEARPTLVSMLQCSNVVHPWLAEVLFRIWPIAQLQNGKADEMRRWDWTGWRSFPLAVHEDATETKVEPSA